jgi:hypothetical protein
MKVRMPTPQPTAAESKPAPAVAAKKPAARRAKNSAKAAEPAAGGVVDPMQWWGALTKQFTTLAASAMKDTAADAAKTLAGTVVKQSVEAANQTLKHAAGAPAKAVRKATAKRRSTPAAPPVV